MRMSAFSKGTSQRAIVMVNVVLEIGPSADLELLRMYMMASNLRGQSLLFPLEVEERPDGTLLCRFIKKQEETEDDTGIHSRPRLY